MSLLTVAGLTFCFAPWDLWPLAYVALVPWTVALAIGRVRWLSIWIATVSGLIFWATDLYWLTWVTPIGHVAGSIYLTLYWRSERGCGAAGPLGWCCPWSGWRSSTAGRTCWASRGCSWLTANTVGSG
ncbi:MAG: hypothetical protein ACYTFO_00945 [Planctomycetota bacterium]